jgi:hypothetical protein
MPKANDWIELGPRILGLGLDTAALPSFNLRNRIPVGQR